MMFIVWGLAFLAVIVIIVLVTIKKGAKIIEIDVERPWKYKIKISMDKSSRGLSDDPNT